MALGLKPEALDGYLSILYLRCGGLVLGFIAFGFLRLSILYLRCATQARYVLYILLSHFQFSI